MSKTLVLKGVPQGNDSVELIRKFFGEHGLASAQEVVTRGGGGKKNQRICQLEFGTNEQANAALVLVQNKPWFTIVNDATKCHSIDIQWANTNKALFIPPPPPPLSAVASTAPPTRASVKQTAWKGFKVWTSRLDQKFTPTQLSFNGHPAIRIEIAGASDDKGVRHLDRVMRLLVSEEDFAQALQPLIDRCSMLPDL